MVTSPPDSFYSSNSDFAGQSVALSGNGLRRAVSAPYKTVSSQLLCGEMQISSLNSSTGVWSVDITLSCPAGYKLLGYGMPGLAFNDNGTLLVAAAVKTPSASISMSACTLCYAAGLVYRFTPSTGWSLVFTLNTISQIKSDRSGFVSQFAANVIGTYEIKMVLSVAMTANGTRVAIGSPYSQGNGCGSVELFNLNGSTSSTPTSEVTWAFTSGLEKCGAGVGVSDSGYPFQVLVGCLGDSILRSFTKPSATSSWPSVGSAKQISMSSDVCTIALAANGQNALAGMCASSTSNGVVQPLAWNGNTMTWQMSTPGWQSGFSGSGDYFGTSLAISADGTTAVVGAFGRKAVLMFKMSGTSAAAMIDYFISPLDNTAGLKPKISTADNYFGAAVAMASNWNTVLVSNVASSSSSNTKPVLIPFSLACAANCSVCTNSTAAGCVTCATGFLKASSGMEYWLTCFILGVGEF